MGASDVAAGEEGDAAAPLICGSASAALTISKVEWEQIETVAPQTRRVGRLFQQAAQEMAEGRAPAQAPLRTFDAALYDLVRGVESPRPAKPAKGGGAGKKADRIRAKTLEDVIKADRARALAAVERSSERSPPRLEAYGGRFESYIFALVLWLRSLPSVAAAIAASKTLRYLGQCVDGVPVGLLTELGALSAGDGDGLEALKTVCEVEELLSTAAPLDAELALHPEQRLFVQEVRAACLTGRPLLLRYETPPSGGKTSASALLGAVLLAEKLKGRHVLYSCFSRTVRVDVCKHLIAASVPFAIVVGGVASPSYCCYNGKPRKPSSAPPVESSKRAEWSLKVCQACDRVPVVLVCDLTSTVCLLRHRSTDVLLFDEPTASLSREMQRQVREVLQTCPSMTVLMSATVPRFEAMPRFVQSFQRRHPGASTLSVATDRLPMSVTALDASGRVWAPHDFGVPLVKIEGIGHLRRFYSPAVLLRMKPEKLSYADVLSYEAVREACFRTLREREAVNGEARGASGDEGELAPGAAAERTSLDMTLFCTSQAAALPGASLVVMDDPQRLLTALTPLLAKVPSLRRLSARSDELARAKTWPAHGKEREELLKSGYLEPPREGDSGLEWPSDCVVNHREHVQRFQGSPSVLPAKWHRALLPLPRSVVETSQTSLVEAALCGVLQLGSDFGDAAFEACAQTLAEQARESYLSAGLQFIYGINLPVERVVVACRGLPFSDMMQLCGRAGRTGRASKAEIVFMSADSLRCAMVPPEEDGHDEAGIAGASLLESFS